MPLTETEMKALGSILREEMLAQLQPFRKEINQRFEAVDRRFEEINQRFEEINQRFEAVDRRFEEINQRFDVVDLRFEKVELRFDKKLQAFRDEIDRRFVELPGVIEITVREQLQPFREEMNQRFDRLSTDIDALYKRDETREQEYLFIREQIRRLESKSP